MTHPHLWDMRGTELTITNIITNLDVGAAIWAAPAKHAKVEAIEMT